MKISEKKVKSQKGNGEGKKNIGDETSSEVGAMSLLGWRRINDCLNSEERGFSLPPGRKGAVTT